MKNEFTLKRAVDFGESCLKAFTQINHYSPAGPKKGKESILHNSLVGGKANMLLFYTKLYDATKLPLYIKPIEDLVADIKTLLKINHLGNYGFYFGKTGLLYAIIKALPYLAQKQDPRDIFFTPVTYQKYLASNATDPSLLFGKSGALLGLLKIYELWPDEMVFDMIKDTTTALLRNSITLNKGINWRRFNSFSGDTSTWLYGATGIGFVLSEAGIVLNNNILMELAHHVIKVDHLASVNTNSKRGKSPKVHLTDIACRLKDPYQNTIALALCILSNYELHGKELCKEKLQGCFQHVVAFRERDYIDLYFTNIFLNRYTEVLVKERISDENEILIPKLLSLEKRKSHNPNCEVNHLYAAHLYLDLFLGKTIDSIVHPIFKPVTEITLDQEAITENYIRSTFPMTFENMRGKFPSAFQSMVWHRGKSPLHKLEFFLTKVQLKGTPDKISEDTLYSFELEKIKWHMIRKESYSKEGSQFNPRRKGRHLLCLPDSKLCRLKFKLSKNIKMVQAENEKRHRPDLTKRCADFLHLLKNFGVRSTIVMPSSESQVTTVRLDFFRTLALIQFEKSHSIQQVQYHLHEFLLLQGAEAQRILLMNFQQTSFEYLCKEIEEFLLIFLKDCVGTGVLTRSSRAKT